MNPTQSEPTTRMAHIEWTYIRDIDDNYAPAEKPMLRLALIGDTVSLAIVKYEETHTEQKFTEVAQIVVDAEPLVAAFNAHVQGRAVKEAHS